MAKFPKKDRIKDVNQKISPRERTRHRVDVDGDGRSDIIVTTDKKKEEKPPNPETPVKKEISESPKKIEREVIPLCKTKNCNRPGDVQGYCGDCARCLHIK